MTEKAKLAWQAQHAPTAASGSPHIGAECPMTDQSRLAWQSQQTETVVRENMMPPPNQIPVCPCIPCVVADIFSMSPLTLRLALCPMMPHLVRILQAPGQTMALSTQRVVSTIPRTVEFTPEHQKDAGSTWVYPSEQMFYNAMKRKGHEPTEEDMRSLPPSSPPQYRWCDTRAWCNTVQSSLVNTMCCVCRTAGVAIQKCLTCVSHFCP